MNVLLVGSGGREHALAWKIAQSPCLDQLYCAPGNPGTAKLGENLPLAGEQAQEMAAFCQQHAIDLVVVGPESPLAAGLVDVLSAAGIPAFGPSQAAAQIEASKAFAKAFMQRHGIPSARFAVFEDFEQALNHLRQVDYPIVLKASGLAAGKGVLLPESLAEAEAGLRALLLEGAFGAAGAQAIIEERLQGEEVSLLAFCDGKTAIAMPPAQDHKRLMAGDRGPNTGGMGAYAPAPVCPPDLSQHILRSILQPAVDGLRAEGMPFVGVLYTGLILTPRGLQVLEFNCRFGDPETQAILPLLESDLLEIMQACVKGRLGELTLRWKPGAAACVVLASQGYPDKSPLGRPIHGLEQRFSNAIVFQAGTRQQDQQVVTAGGRVLGVTGWAEDLAGALSNAYSAVQKLHFEGMQYRQDIGWRAQVPASRSSAYSQAGVDIDIGNRAVDMLRAAVRATYGPEVLAGVGAFGGQFDAARLKDMHAPVLVTSIDGVGTKVKLAAQARRYASLGHDIVNHCINDILVQGARPLFFLDYFASARLQPEIVAEIVGGMAAACQQAGCALLGGETAEMPGVYAPGEFDIAGAIVGVVERSHLLPRPDLQAGDMLLGLRSSGLHTNGFSLVRKIFAGVPLETRFPELEASLGEVLLAPHRSYLAVLEPVLERLPGKVKALAHITGGGLVENLPRVLPEGLGAVIWRERWPIPPIFALIQNRGQVDAGEMYRVFNMGIGMLVAASPQDVEALQAVIPETLYPIGELVPGGEKVALA
ncbi:MAG: phosphoribosylamine--glycine ligase [Chloroflexota bacterium]